MMRRLFVAGASLLFAGMVCADDLPIEPIPNVATLPEHYPDSWLFVHDSNFLSILDGKVVLVDPTVESHQYKGAIGAAQFASFVQSKTRPELYVGETFFSRGTRGERTDVVTIYNTTDLAPIGEVLLTGDKRAQLVPQKGALQVSGDGKFLFVFNFTPAASVSIIDLDRRSILNEIQIPGCSLVYPFGDRSFATLCGNGTMMSYKLDESAKIVSRNATGQFNDIDHDPLFMKSAAVGGHTYFTSFKGVVQPIDFTDDKAVAGEAWTIPGSAAAGGNYRPAGWMIFTSSENTGRLYALMNEGAGDGDHKNGGGEVWVIDPATKSVEKKFKLNTWGISIEVTGGERPLLAVATPTSDLEFYDAQTGEFVRSIGGYLAVTPFMMHAVK